MSERERPLALEERRAVLQGEIARLVQRGYRVVSQTDTTAQMVFPKTFSCFWFLVGFGIFYLIYYLAKRDKQIYITVDEWGAIGHNQVARASHPQGVQRPQAPAAPVDLTEKRLIAVAVGAGVLLLVLLACGGLYLLGGN